MFSLKVHLLKIFVITVKDLEPVTSCIRDKDATTALARHM